MAGSFRLNLDFFTAEAEKVEKSKKLIQKYLAEGVVYASMAWFTKYFPLHFQRVGASRYGFARRTPNWYKIKSRAKRARDSKGSYRPTTRPATDNVWSGELRDDLKVTTQNVKKLATTRYRGYRMKIRISIPIPHPVRPEYHNEITRISPDEYQEIGFEALEHAAREMGLKLGWRQNAQGAA